MSAKWRAMQHKHRYTYNSVLFPKPYIETLNVVPPEMFSTFIFFSKLKDLIQLNSTYSQVSAVKDLSSSFAQLLNSPNVDEAGVSTAIRLYLEILFLENSLPLHRALISPLIKNKKCLPMINSCFADLCKAYGDSSKNGKNRFLVSRAALSMMGCPKLGFLNEALEKCSVLVASDIANGLSSVVSDVENGCRPSPLVMEQCQDAMSCLYYLLQKFPHGLSVLEDSFCTFEKIVGVILSVLKSSVFSRDCLVAAGVSFCAAIQALIMRAEDASYFISSAVFGFSVGDRDIIGLNLNLALEISVFPVLSRLCLLRGILTAMPRSVLNTCFKSPDGTIWTILYSAILPELCEYSEKPIDSHFNFHVLTVLQICLQQIKTSILEDLICVSADYHYLSEVMTSRLLSIVWNNLEDPLSQTVKQVHFVFDLLLDIKSSLSSKNYNKNRPFLCKTALDLLHFGACRKGKYVPLASIAKRLGSKFLLELNSNLLFETTNAYMDDDVCCAATLFLKFFLECLRDECWSHSGIDKGYDIFRKLCLLPLLDGLMSGNSKLRTNLNTYALPALLEVDPESIFPLLSFISVGPYIDNGKSNAELKVGSCVAALVSLLKVSRTLALIEGDIDLDPESVSESCNSEGVALVCIKGLTVKVLVKWLVMALTHADESIRIDAAESLFLNPKTSSLPSSLELRLMREAVPLNMRCPSTAFHMKWTSLFRKFFSRVRTALEKQMKQGMWQPSACTSVDCTDAVVMKNSSVIHKAENLFQFMKWLSCYLFCSCYPSAPYERKMMAMELILIMMNFWPPNQLLGIPSLHPYIEGFICADLTILFVGSIIDSWDRLRENSFRILLCFPTPLPGISTFDALNMVVRWAKRLVCSPRVRESDAGALTFRLIFRKYVIELGWVIETSLNFAHIDSQLNLLSGDLYTVKYKVPLVAYMDALVEWLHVTVEGGERDLSEACKSSFVHGILLTLRYTFEELDWSSKEVMFSATEMRCLLQKLFNLIVRVTSLALWVVSADAWYMPYDIDDVIDGSDFLSDSVLAMDFEDFSLEQAAKVQQFDDNGKPAEHAVMVGCWLAMKEVSLLLGTIIRKVPLPSCSLAVPSGYALNDCVETEMVAIEDGMLDLQQLESIGSHFLQVLLKMKHNGAIDKTRAGFTALCNRLLCSNNPRLCKMPETWMEQLKKRMVAGGQTVDDLLRRSAGIPAAYIAFFLSEPERAPKLLLPRALTWLINVAQRPLLKCSEDSSRQSLVPLESFIEDQWESNVCNSKMRDEGIIPTVHAFNVLRATFNDTNLAADTSGFCSEALIIAIRSFSSPYWEVRNSACLAYAALVRRMIGFLNVQDMRSTRRSLTGLEFFHRYPAIHPFLYNELEFATKQLGAAYLADANLNIAKSVHPSLCPILILLSRLKPSVISSEPDDTLDPYLLMPFLRNCGTQSNLRVRDLAARALIGLVSNEKLQVVLTEIAHELPHERHQMAKPTFTFNSIHGTLLQLCSLFDKNCRNLSDNVKKDDILGDIIQSLLPCSWIGSYKACPCPILNKSFLLVLDHMFSIAVCYSSKHVDAIRTLLTQLALECISEEKTPCGYFDPTLLELRKQAVASYFNCLLGSKQEASSKCFDVQNSSKSNSTLGKITTNYFCISEHHEKIVSCISDCMYEVRIITFKKLLCLANSMCSHGSGGERSATFLWVKTDLQPALMQHLAKEGNPKCIYCILKIIFSCNVVEIGGFTDCNTAFNFWDRLVYLLNTVKHSKTREILLCCMAVCTKSFSKILRNHVSGELTQIQEETAKAFHCIGSFIILIKQHSEPSEPVNMRRAAAQATVASGLLEEANFVASHVSNNFTPPGESHGTEEEFQADMPVFVHFYACRILDLWFVCIQLLEDEDTVLRQKFAKDVQKCIYGGGSDVPRQVDLVIGVSLGFLSKCFGHWFVYLDYVLGYISAAASCVSFGGDLVRKIFEKEKDNHHEEKLLICQMLCFHLENLLVPGSEVFKNSSHGKLVLKWRLRFLRQLLSFAEGFLMIEGQRDWIGGMGNHKEVFMSLYSNLLCLYVLAQYSESSRGVDEIYLSDFSKLKRIMGPFLRNPLISNLYSLVIRSHERMVISFNKEPAEPEADTSIWDGFDPYFLLR